MASSLGRRQALSGAAAVGLGVPLLAACGDDGGATAADSAGSSSPPTSSAPSGSPATGGTTKAGKPSTGLVATADVPVGGGVVLPDEELVVTQPTEGEFKAFTAICTHQGCLVGSVEGGEIVCPCHASHFSISDGSVASGPAGSPLAESPVQVEGGQVVAG